MLRPRPAVESCLQWIGLGERVLIRDTKAFSDKNLDLAGWAVIDPTEKSSKHRKIAWYVRDDKDRRKWLTTSGEFKATPGGTINMEDVFKATSDYKIVNDTHSYQELPMPGEPNPRDGADTRRR